MNRLFVAVLCGVYAGCAGQPSRLPVPSAPVAYDVDSARVLARMLVERERLPGLAVTVSVGASVVWREGFGFADLTTAVEATPETKFRIGSVSKLLTATLLMRLVEEQRVELDVPVERYVTLP